MLIYDLTAPKVHAVIKDIDSHLPDYESGILVSTVADALHVNPSDISPHIDILYNLTYIRFADRSNQKIFLTPTGKYTLVP